LPAALWQPPKASSVHLLVSGGNANNLSSTLNSHE
jgi:hypothetical protein